MFILFKKETNFHFIMNKFEFSIISNTLHKKYFILNSFLRYSTSKLKEYVLIRNCIRCCFYSFNFKEEVY
jgi:hypothetical protein